MASRGSDPPVRELLLLRHAKSRHDASSLDDHQRDLSPRGMRAACRMGEWLEQRKILPDLVLCSSAVRARRTVELMAANRKSFPEVRHFPALYLATPGALLEILRRQPGEMRRLLLVGHNPGLHHLALRLIGNGPADLRHRLAAKYPTAALARISFDLPLWSDLQPGSGFLLDFVRPRDLG